MAGVKLSLEPGARAFAVLTGCWALLGYVLHVVSPSQQPREESSSTITPHSDDRETAQRGEMTCPKSQSWQVAEPGLQARPLSPFLGTPGLHLEPLTQSLPSPLPLWHTPLPLRGRE